MPSKQRKRCVFGCVTKGVTIHSFPNPIKHPKRFLIWAQLAGESVKGLTEKEIHKNKKVCDRHFREDHKNRNHRLNILAIPTMHIPSLPDSDVISLENKKPDSSDLSIDMSLDFRNKDSKAESSQWLKKWCFADLSLKKTD